jgi:tRNA pseudouridine55 synthase
MATGVLVLLLGRAAKACEYAVAGKKRYTARVRLGIETDTEDITGEIIRSAKVNVSREDFDAVLPSFIGDIMQIPPMYSALKRDGKKLCDLAREGKVIEREARPITVYSIKAEQIDGTDYTLDVTCSAGTYIRTLCADIGASLGCGGAMAALERTETCGYSLSDAHTLDKLNEISLDERLALLLPTETLFSSLNAVKLEPFYEKLFRSGCEIYFKKLRLIPPEVGTRLRVCDSKGEFFALGEVRDYPDGTAIKSLKLFKL